MLCTKLRLFLRVHEFEIHLLVRVTLLGVLEYLFRFLKFCRSLARIPILSLLHPHLPLPTLLQSVINLAQ